MACRVNYCGIRGEYLLVNGVGRIPGKFPIECERILISKFKFSQASVPSKKGLSDQATSFAHIKKYRSTLRMIMCLP